MESRVALVSIIVEDLSEIDRLNSILHEYGDYIIGRMGIPYRQREINIISVAMDAPQDVINTMSGRLGRIEGITSRAMYSKVTAEA